MAQDRKQLEKDTSDMTDDELRAYFAAEDAGEIEFTPIHHSLPPLPELPEAEGDVVVTFAPRKPADQTSPAQVSGSRAPTRSRVA